MYIFQTPTVEILDSTFKSLFAVKGAGIHIINELNKELMNIKIMGSKFIKNKAARGGGLYVDGLSSTDLIDSIL